MKCDICGTNEGTLFYQLYNESLCGNCYEKQKCKYMYDKFGNALTIGDAAQVGDMIGKIILWKGKLMLEVKNPIDCMDVGLIGIKEEHIIKIF